jgi:hypothetical protein
MKTFADIFPIVLNDNSIETIQSMILELTTTCLRIHSNTFPNSHDCMLLQAKAILHLEDLVRNPNSIGYSYNSYLLNSAALKLDFIAFTIQAHSLTHLKEQLYIINKSIKTINDIIKRAYYSQPRS